MCKSVATLNYEIGCALMKVYAAKNARQQDKAIQDARKLYYSLPLGTDGLILDDLYSVCFGD